MSFKVQQLVDEGGVTEKSFRSAVIFSMCILLCVVLFIDGCIKTTFKPALLHESIQIR